MLLLVDSTNIMNCYYMINMHVPSTSTYFDYLDWMITYAAAG